MFATISRNCLSGAGQKRHRISRDVAIFFLQARNECCYCYPSHYLIHASENASHECARCSGPSTTRCSRCKAVRYCSGEGQIIYWKQGHKHECQQLETNSRISSPVAAYTSIDTIGVPIMERRFIDERVSIKSKLRKEDGAVLHSIKGASRKEFKIFDFVFSKEEIPRKHNVNICGGFSNGHTSSRSTTHHNHDLQSQHGNILNSN